MVKNFMTENKSYPVKIQKNGIKMAIFARAHDFSSFRQLKNFCYSIILHLFDLKKIAAHFNDKKSGF